MATRNSPYSALLNQQGFDPKIPDWVFGANLGDLSGQLARREVAIMQPIQQQQQIDANRIALEEKQRQQEYERSVAEMISGQQEPPKLRDLYGMMAGQAAKFGNMEDYSKLQGRLADLEEQDRKSKLTPFDDIADALRLGAASGDPEIARKRLEAAGVDYQIPATAIQGMLGKGKKESAPRSERQVFVTKDGIEQSIPISQFNDLAKAGWTRSRGSGMDDLAMLFAGIDPGMGGIERASEQQKQVVDSIAPQPPGQPSPGMKWQYNKKTGEYREVPR